MDTKSAIRVEVKDADKGEVTAVFSTFDVVDKDGDVTLPGAFEDGAAVRISAYGHTSWSGALPVGKGTIRTTKTEAIVDGQFFLNTSAGRDTFEVVKELGSMQEWSYGYDPLEYDFGERDGKHVRFLKKQKVHEVSPVLLGAGENTRTLTTKSHLTLVDEATAVLAAAKALGDRAADVMAKRQEKGKGLGTESAALIALVEAELKRFADFLTVPDEPSPEELQAEYLRFLSRESRFRQGVSA